MVRYNTNGSSALAPNDPYNDMEGAEIRPNLQVLDGGRTTPSNNKSGRNNLKVINGGKSNNSKDLLRDSENSALSGNSPTFGSPWKNSVTGLGNRNQGKGAQGKGKGSFFKQRKGLAAMIVSLCLLAGGGAFLGSSHSLLAPAMESLMTTATDTQHASFVLRTGKIVNFANSHSSTSDNMTKKYTNISTTEVQAKSSQGRVATFFDNMATKIYNKLGLSRNMFRGYKQTGDADADMDSFRNTMKPEYDNDSSTIRGIQAESQEVPETNPDGSTATNPDGTTKMKTQTTVTDAVETTGSSNNSATDATQKAETFVSSTAAKAAIQAANGACNLMRVGATISAIVAANEIYQSINYFMNYMENISKMKYGEGNNSAINEVLNTLTASVSTTLPDVNDVHGAGKGSTVTGAPVQANGIQAMLANAPLSADTTKNYSLERTGNAVATALNMSAGSVYACAGVQAGAAVVSIITTIGTLGASAIGQAIFNTVSGVAIGGATTLTLGFLIPTIASVLFTNIFETTIGIPSGELFARGASAANTRVGRSGSGQSLSSAGAARAYDNITQDVIAKEAEEDRKNRSPFDITSKNTFLGSIAYQLLPITLFSAKSSTAVITNINTLTRATSSAVASLTNSASAASSSSYMSNFGDCPNLAEIGAVGDIYCNPITTTDPYLIDIEPDNHDYTDTLGKELDCDNDGNCTIDKDGGLAKYINYCDGRDSPFGIVDANILGELEAGNFILNALPVVGDIIDIANSADSIENLKWATGQKCVNNIDTNSDWETFKYYQRYIEDQRILDWAGAYGNGQSPVLAYETQYEQEHPLDNSPAGYLARISGVTKDDAETVLAIIDYYNFLKEYEPETRIAINADTNRQLTGEEHIAQLNSQNQRLNIKANKSIDTPVIAMNHYIIYADLRNRSYAV